MAAWHPFADEALGALAAQGIERAIALPLYPHESRTTTGSSLNQLEHARARQAGAGDRDRRDPALSRRRRLRARGRGARRGGDRDAARRAPRHRAGAVLGARAARGVHQARRSLSRRRAHHRRDRHPAPRARARARGSVSRAGSARNAGWDRRPRRCSTSWRRRARPPWSSSRSRSRASTSRRCRRSTSSTRSAPTHAGIVHFARARTVGCHPAFIAALADLVEATAHARGWA